MILIKEHLAKKMLEPFGIPVPKSFLAEGDFRPFWSEAGVFLKAQVGLSSRKKAGLIAEVKKESDLQKSFEQMKATLEESQLSPEILIEEKIPHEKEYYLGILSDPIQRRPVILFSVDGGIEVEHSALVSGGGLRRLPIDMSESGDVIGKNVSFFREAGVSDDEEARLLAEFASRLYQAYRHWHCRFVEINPLVKSGNQFVALDAKMSVDEDAIPLLEPAERKVLEGLKDQRMTAREKIASQVDLNDYRGSCHYQETDCESVRKIYGDSLKAFVGYNGVGTGVSLTAMDELVRRGFYPRNFCDTSGNPPASKLYQATRLILAQDNIRGYFFISCMSSQQLDNTARGIIKAFKEFYASTGGIPNIPTLLVFRGAWDEEAKNLFSEHGIHEGPLLMIKGRETTERSAVQAFEKLYDAYVGR